MTPIITQLHRLGKNSWRCDLKERGVRTLVARARAGTALGAYVNAYAALRRDGLDGRYQR